MEVKGLTIERLRQQAHDMRKAAKELQLRYKCQTSKPIAKMSKKELTEFLIGVYTKELNYCCRMLVEHFHEYN
jgi:endonuclease III